MTRFDGKVALVTGGASGIGAAVGERLLAEGAQVVLVDINDEGLQKSAANAGGQDLATVAADVTSESQVQAAVATAVDTFGRLDLAFNIAGGVRIGPIIDISEEDFAFTIDLILKGTFLVSQHAARAMRDGGRGGAIVNVSSLNAHVPLYGGSAYAAAKAGVEVFTKNCALEFAQHNIRVNAVLPGLVETPMTAPFLSVDALRDDFLARIPEARGAQPDEIARAVLFLASEDASYVNGTSLVVDGGWEISNYPNLAPYI